MIRWSNPADLYLIYPHGYKLWSAGYILIFPIFELTPDRLKYLVFLLMCTLLDPCENRGCGATLYGHRVASATAPD